MKKWGGPFLLISLFVLMTGALYAIFQIAPTEANMGDVQRIFYFHVSSAWISFLFFFLVLLGSLLYIWKRDTFWDDFAWASAELGFLFCTIVLLTGPIWARPVWGVWWTWDPRLTTTLILWGLYGAYLLLRQGVEPPEKQALFAAVYGIFAFLDVPIVVMAVRWWRGIHPVVIEVGKVSLDPLIFQVLLFSAAALLLFAGFLFAAAVAIKRLERMLSC